MNASNKHKNRPHKSRKITGLTLVELMIAITLGIMIVGAIGTFFIHTKQSSRQNESFARLQENGRYALHLLAEELQHVGFFGKMSYLNDYSEDTTTLSSITGVNCVDNDWIREFDPPLLYNSGTKKGTTGSVESGIEDVAYTCITDDDIYDGIGGSGTDIMTIKSTLPIPVAVEDLKDNYIYLRTNGDKSCLWQKPEGEGEQPSSDFCASNDDSLITKDTDDWELTTSVYYISENDDQAPSLYRKTLVQGAEPEMKEQLLVEGIERFVIEFGINDGINVGTTDKVIDRYSTILPDDLTKVMSARIYVLVRADKPDWNYTNINTYNLGETEVNPIDDNYYRKVFSTTVILRNLFNKSNFP